MPLHFVFKNKSPFGFLSLFTSLTHILSLLMPHQNFTLNFAHGIWSWKSPPASASDPGLPHHPLPWSCISLKHQPLQMGKNLQKTQIYIK